MLRRARQRVHGTISSIYERLAGELVQVEEFWDDDQRFYGHQYLGLVALHHGDVATARAELLSAGKYGRRSPVLASFGPELPLAKELLDRGERDTVIAFLDDLEVIWEYEAERVRKWRAAVRRGETPSLDRFGPDQY